MSHSEDALRPPGLPTLPSPSSSSAQPGSRGGGPTVVLGVSGSIAAFKAVEVARLLLAAGRRVVPVMTASAEQFLGPATLSGICGERAHHDMFDRAAGGEIHVELARQASAVALVPATAELLAAVAGGRANDVLRALVLCTDVPVLAAPAMHPRMWAHPATQRNVATLVADGRVSLVGPVYGEVANGERGVGRMAEPDAIAAAVLARLGPRDLVGVRIVVTAGPTVEDIDPVRFVSNRSSGKMGFAVAERAAARGAEVALIAGPVSLPTPYGVRRIDVRSAEDLRQALWEALGPKLDRADALVMAAAVADYRVAKPRRRKMKRRTGASGVRLALTPNRDLLAEVGAKRKGGKPYLIGFALETEGGDALVAAGRAKLKRKRVDMVVANTAADAFDRDHNRAALVMRDCVEQLAEQPKRKLADRLLDHVVAVRGG